MLHVQLITASVSSSSPASKDTARNRKMLDGTDLGMDFEIRALSARGDIGFDVVSKGNNKFLDFRLIGIIGIVFVW